MDPMHDPMRALGLTDLGDEYRPLPPSRWSEPWSANVVTVLTVVGALVVGFLISAGAFAGRTVAEQQDARKAELIVLIEQRQERVDALAAHLEDLRVRVAEVEEAAAAGIPALARELERIEQVAGITAVQGPGVVVTLEDADGACPSGQQQDCEIRDADLQLAVNHLFDAGAEAVAINGERIIATTAIRNAGRAILVNYRVLTPPYDIMALGDPETLEAAFLRSDFARDFELWTDVYGLGFSVAPEDALELPAYGGSIRLQHAVVAEQGGR
jgi:uncharacterized protein YlxW (UPF0749 family)